MPEGDAVNVDGRPGLVHEAGLLIQAEDGAWLNVEVLKLGGRTINASRYGKALANGKHVEFTEEERLAVESIRKIWEGILNREVGDDVDFFASGECVRVIYTASFFCLPRVSWSWDAWELCHCARDCVI